MKKPMMVLICAMMAFSACNKDDDGPVKEPKNETVKPPKEETVEPPAVLTGVFRDSEVQGLSFSTTTQNGITNDKGEFTYLEGETVTFKVGELTLGSATGAALITPISLLQTVDASASIESHEVQNMAAFLQTLDKDADHSNGIEINASVVGAIGLPGIDFSVPIESTLADIVLNVAQNEGTALKIVYPGEAAENMAGALNIEYTASPNYTLTHFMPTLKAYFQSYDRNHTPASAVYKNTFDEEGKLLSTSIISRFSGKVFYDFTFSAYATNGQPTNGSYTQYNAASLNGGSFGFQTSMLDIELTYNADNQLATFTELRDGQRFNTNQFTAFDEENRPLAYFRDLAENDSDVTFTISLSFTYENGLIKTSGRDYYREETGEDYYYLDETQRDFTYTYNEYNNITVIDYPRSFEFTSILNGEENNSLLESVAKETFKYDSSQKLTSITKNEQGTNTDGSSFLQNSVSIFDENELLESQNYTSPNSETSIDYEAGLQVSYVSIFNGQVTREEEYGDDGSSVSTTYYYDVNGNLKDTIKREYNADFNLFNEVYTYFFEDGTVDAIYDLDYDANGNRIKETGLDANGDIFSVWYYEKNLLTRQDIYFEGEFDYYSEYTYNDTIELIALRNFWPDGELFGMIAYTYYPDGNWESLTYSDANGEVYLNDFYEYDEDGFLLRITGTGGNGITNYILFYENGVLVREEIYDDSGELVDVIEYNTTGKSSVLAQKRSNITANIVAMPAQNHTFVRETSAFNSTTISSQRRKNKVKIPTNNKHLQRASTRIQKIRMGTE
ncbi:hypothetical protein ACFQZJ_01930 [Maribacter chungangensis]|uniref:Uncharacterized protein n=1 Tax=Maribacter chungangensis TaxID=1069117 RepID=A0ABW3B0Q5_9FLAO